MSRPATQASGRLPLLPQIQHPLSRGTPGAHQLDTLQTAHYGSGGPASNLLRSPSRRTVSRTGELMVSRNYTPRSAAADAVDPEVLSPRVGEKGYREITVRFDDKSKSSAFPKEAVTGKTRELEDIAERIRFKCKNQPAEVKRKFEDNDPQGLGRVSREGLLRVLISLAGVSTISQPQLQRLLEALGLQSQSNYHFNDLLCSSTSRHQSASALPSWVGKTSKSETAAFNLTASQVEDLLKSRAESNLLRAFDTVPQDKRSDRQRIMKPEFRHALSRHLRVDMSDAEFDKLWQKYDARGEGMIDGERLMMALGIIASGRERKEDGTDQTNCLRRREEDRKRSLDIEAWLRDHFRTTFNAMKNSFSSVDRAGSCLVTANEFCEVMEQHGLKLKLEHLDEFLSRCNVTRVNGSVPYVEFLTMFQTRGENGMTHKILSDGKFKYAKLVEREDNSSAGFNSTLSTIEVKLMNMFQEDFLKILGVLHNLDPHHTGVVSRDDFRAVLESKLDIELTDSQYTSLLDQVQLDKYGNVRYQEFMAQFDSGSEVRSVRTEVGQRPELNIEESSPPSIELMCEKIRTLLTENFDAVKECFLQMDEYHSNRMTHDTVYQLLKRLQLKPVLSRGDVRRLWSVLFTNKDDSISWPQFIRQFGHTGETHTYINSRKHPPVLGDSDYSLKSRRLNSDNEIIMDSTAHLLKSYWDDLRRSFLARDRTKLGYLSSNEFRSTVKEICSQISEFELNKLTNECSSADDQVNYVKLLAQFRPSLNVWQTGNDMFTLLSHPHSSLYVADVVSPPQHGLIGLTARLRDQLSHNWKNLRRAFRKLDRESSGYLSLLEFREVLRLADVVVDEDEVYHLMSALDEDLTGRLDYNRFLGQIFRPASQQSSSRLSNSRLSYCKSPTRLPSRLSALSLRQ